MNQTVAKDEKQRVGGVAKPDGRRTRHAHRRPELLAAATDYVLAHGLEGLSIRPLAAALGISHRTLLYHFGSKERLIAEVLHEARDRDRLAIAFAADTLRDAPAEQVLDAAWRQMSQQRDYWRFFFEAYGIALKEPERYARFLDGIVEEWLVVIEQLLVRAGCAPDAAPPLASLVLASFRGLFLDLLATGERARVDAAAAQLTRAVRLLLDAARQSSP